ncbi:MAG TPA: hypothetical protein VM733_09805 [Thermoanaerobaculia bacterium]|nr:hypothetical protein [Thermoanaerobaculia bacterium]
MKTPIPRRARSEVMSKGEHPKPRFVRRVTRAHAARFAARWIDNLPDREPGTMYLAFESARVMTWPDRERGSTPAQEKYEAIEDAILKRTAELSRDAIAEAFQQAATEVFDRERARRQR